MSSVSVFDLAKDRTKLHETELKSNDPLVWSDPQKAQRLMQEASKLRHAIQPWDNLELSSKELFDLVEMALADKEETLFPELQEEFTSLEKQLKQLEISSLLAGEHDLMGAIISINPGAGGTDACDWAEMIARMYRRWADNQGYKFQIADAQPAEEAGLKSFTAIVEGDFAYGNLKAEKGVHRLVRLSPFDADKQRHTSFAAVDVIPEIGQDIEIEIRPDDLKLDTFLASANGGQNVQKNETAVRLTHLPSGLVVSAQSERSQHRNRTVALEILRSRLYELERRKREEELSKLRGEQRDIAFGNQIRSYVLHPYQLVKDHRTNLEIGAVETVLGGRIDPFIRAYLELTAKENT